MKRELNDLLCCPSCQGDLALHDETPEQAEVESGQLLCRPCNIGYPIVRGIPRFVSSDQYVGSFSYEWNRWNRVQLDVANGRRESEEAFAQKTGFAPEELKDKLVLDVGCGAGRFLDVASRWGARIVGVDLSFAVDAAHQNVGSRENVAVVQADVFHLPFRPETFDAIFSIGVLHHSRDTREAFLRLPRLLKDKGDIVVWLYYYPDRLFRVASDVWRTVWRPFPTWALYSWCWLLVTLLSWLWRKPALCRKPWSNLRRVLPISTHEERQWRILDTFDWYSPRFQDKTCSPGRVVGWCREAGLRDVRVLEAQPTTVRARRDGRRQLKPMRYSVPDVREHRVLVFGGGSAGASAVRLIRRVAPEQLVGIVDNDPAKEGTRIESVTVRRFDRVARDTYDLVVIASMPGRQAIGEQLSAAGLVEGRDFIGLDVMQKWYRQASEYEAWVAA
jgi:SAM-dependent methyltransferase